MKPKGLNTIMYEIKSIEIELTTVCNAHCPICIRYDARDEGLFINPKANINQLIDIDIIETIFKSDKLSDHINVDLIGTSGEPLAHPKILDIIKLIVQHKPKAKLNIHTNGGLRTTKFFAELARILPLKSRVCFSLDGLADTNHLYRIGVNFDKAISNLTAFVEAGGRAIWQFVIFDWNEHQQEECKKYALDLGCHSFETRTNVDPDAINASMISAKKQISNIVSPLYEPLLIDKIPLLPDYDYIDDVCIQNQEIFIGPDGKVYPCCMFYAAKAGPSDKQVDADMYKKFGHDWNDLTIHSLDRILEHLWWDELHTSITERPCHSCIDQCGTKRDERSVSNIEETGYELS